MRQVIAMMKLAVKYADCELDPEFGMVEGVCWLIPGKSRSAGPHGCGVTAAAIIRSYTALLRLYGSTSLLNM